MDMGRQLKFKRSRRSQTRRLNLLLQSHMTSCYYLYILTYLRRATTGTSKQML